MVVKREVAYQNLKNDMLRTTSAHCDRRKCKDVSSIQLVAEEDLWNLIPLD